MPAYATTLSISEYTTSRVNQAPTPEIRDRWSAAHSIHFRQNNPDQLAKLLREDLAEAEQAEQRAPTPEASQNSLLVRYLLEELASIYGNKVVWGDEWDRRQVDQIDRVTRYVSDRVRAHEDSGDESLEHIAQTWHDAGEAFMAGNTTPLLNLVLRKSDPAIANILRAWGR